MVAQAIANVVGDDLDLNEINEKIEVPKSIKMGDFAFPAFVLAKVMHKAPQMIAQDIVEKIDQTGFEKVEAAGPYVNFFLDKKQFGKEIVSEVLDQKEHYGDQDLGHQGNVTIDMSSPNIAKPMSMGHLRSTVIGNSLAEILKKTNYNPIKINHLGDWGTQFGKLIEAYKLWGNEEDVKKDPINTLLKYYVRFHKEDQEHPELDDEARAWFKKLEDGDPEATRLWKWFREESLSFFMKIYKRLGITFDSYNGEAFYNDKMQPVIDELKEKGLLEESQGAMIVDLSKYDNLTLPEKDVWGVIMRSDSPLAGKDRIKLHDLLNVPLIASRQMSKKYSADSGFLDWFGEEFDKLNITATYNLVYNAAIMVRAGMGYAITLDKLINTSKSDGIVFRPLEPKLESGLDIVWKKYQVFSPAGKIFLEKLQKNFNDPCCI